MQKTIEILAGPSRGTLDFCKQFPSRALEHREAVFCTNAGDFSFRIWLMHESEDGMLLLYCDLFKGDASFYQRKVVYNPETGKGTIQGEFMR